MSGRYNLLTYIRRPSNQSIDPNDTSFQSQANITGRTISSSSASSMMSTPSNNIRSVVEQRQQRIERLQQEQQPQQEKGEGTTSSSSTSLGTSRIRQKNRKSNFLNQRTSTNVKSKLLNLLKSSKLYNSSTSDINHLQDLVAININQTIESISTSKERDKNKNNNNNSNNNQNQNIKKTLTSSLGNNTNKKLPLAGYDYSVFVKKPEDYLEKDSYQRIRDGEANSTSTSSASAGVKESQLKAWESAEKVTKNLIFNASDSEDEDVGKEDEEIIKSIPGFTTSELNLVLSRGKDRFRGKLQTDEDEEDKILWEFRQRHQVSQERIFAQYLSINEKRKVQISQKKEFLARIFGSLNNLNQSFITNNTSYSINENLPNNQLTFEEDKEEIAQILEEDEFFQRVLQETNNLILNKKIPFNKRNKNGRRKSLGSVIDSNENLDDFNNEKFQNFISQQLNKFYNENLLNFKRDERTSTIGDNIDEDLDYTQENIHNDINSNIEDEFEDENDIDGDHEELQNFALSYLRKCIKEDIDSDTASD